LRRVVRTGREERALSGGRFSWSELAKNLRDPRKREGKAKSPTPTREKRIDGTLDQTEELPLTEVKPQGFLENPGGGPGKRAKLMKAGGRDFMWVCPKPKGGEDVAQMIDSQQRGYTSCLRHKGRGSCC